MGKKELAALKVDYRKKYGKQYKEEERKESSLHNDELRAERNNITNEFINSFFLPLRQKYEADIAWYQENFPIKESDMEPEPVKVEHIYAYGD